MSHKRAYRKEKHHPLGYTILVVVLLVAFSAIYYMYSGVGRAIEVTQIDVQELGTCTCMRENVFTVPASVLVSDPDLYIDCKEQCAQSHAVALN